MVGEAQKDGLHAMVDAAGGPLGDGLGDDLPATADEGTDLFGERPKKGRPKGSRNKRTKELLDDLVASGLVMPLEFLIRKMNDPNVPLSEQIKCALGAAQYCHQKQPVQVDTQGAPAVLVIGELPQDQAHELSDDGLITLEILPQENPTKSNTYEYAESVVELAELNAND